MSLKAFLRQNAQIAQNLKVVISDRFVGDDDKPLEWELRSLTEAENAKIKEECTNYSTDKRRRVAAFDGGRYTKRLTAESVVYPDLRDAELQASYGVANEIALLNTMLISGEFATLQEAVQQINKFDAEKLSEVKEETKNS